MPPNWPTYAWYSAAVILGAMGLVLLIKWLIGDRSKGRRRCPKCWYDMSATPGLTCPECGRTQSREKRFFRTRRRAVGFFIAALSLFFAHVCQLVPRVQSWYGFIPTTILMFLVPDVTTGLPPQQLNFAFPGKIVTPPPSTLAEELHKRYQHGPLWSWQWRYITSRAAPIPTELEHALSLRPSHVLGQPFCFCVDASKIRTSAPPSPSITRKLIATPRISDTETAAAPCYGGYSIARAVSLPPELLTVTFDLAIVEYLPWSKEPLVLSRDTAVRQVTVVDDVVDTYRSISPSLVQDSFAFTIERVTSNGPMRFASMNASVSLSPRVPDLAPYLEVEIFDADRCVAKGVLTRCDGEHGHLSFTSQDFYDRLSNCDSLAEESRKPAWRVKLTGIPPKMACDCIHRTAFMGSIEFQPPQPNVIEQVDNSSSHERERTIFID